MIKNVIFDFGGVVVTLCQPEAIRRFTALGLSDAHRQLDAYTQGGIFGELEIGKITAEEFRQKLSHMVHRPLTFDECLNAWLGYRGDLPERNLQALVELRRRGYRLILLSNTNPYMMSWAESSDFDGHGHTLNDYFDTTYMSYRLGMMKPDIRLFQHVISHEHILPEETLFVDDGPRNVEMASTLGIHTFCPANGSDWTAELYNHL